MTSTPTRIPIWRPASPQPLGSLAPMAATARDTEHLIVIRALTAADAQVVVPLSCISGLRNHAITRVPGYGLEATSTAAGAGDPGPAAGDVRGAGGGAARASDRRAGEDRALPAHQRPQPRRRLRSAARAVPDLGGSAGRAYARAGGGDPSRRPGEAEGAAD